MAAKAAPLTGSIYPAAPSIVPLHHTRTPLTWAKSAVSREIASQATTGIATIPAFRRIAARERERVHVRRREKTEKDGRELGAHQRTPETTKGAHHEGCGVSWRKARME